MNTAPVAKDNSDCYTYGIILNHYVLADSMYTNLAARQPARMPDTQPFVDCWHPCGFISVQWLSCSAGAHLPNLRMLLS